MNIFSKRPLGTILCIVLTAFLLFSDLSVTFCLISACVILFLFLISFLSQLKNIKSIKFARVILCSVLVAILFIQIFLYRFFPEQYYGKDCEIEGLVTEVDDSSIYEQRLTVDAESINGNNESFKLYVTIPRANSCIPERGDYISFKAQIIPFENTEAFSSKNYYVAKGYSAQASDPVELKIISSGNYVPFSYFTDLREDISTRLISLTNNECGGLLTALLLGERDNLDPEIELNFSRIGITHILALSGMHLSMLAFAISSILSLFNINKRLRVATVTLFAVLYTILTGMPSSVVRACVMLVISSLLYLFANTKDSLTTLSVAVFLIVLVSPYAIYDISLWLSALSTFGILSFFEYRASCKVKKNLLLRFVQYLCDSLLSTLFAVGASFVITVRYFTTFSAITPFTTALFSAVIQPYVYCGLLLLVLGGMFPLSNFMIEYTKHLKYLSDLFADLRWITVFYDIPLVKLLIALFIILFSVFLIFKIKRKKLFLSLISIVYLSVFVSGIVLTDYYTENDYINYAPLEYSDTFIIVDEGETALVFSGSAVKSEAYLCLNNLTKNKITYLDKLILTDYSYGTPLFVDTLDNEIKCNTVHLPIPRNETELDLAATIAEILSISSTDLSFYENELPIKLGDTNIHLFRRTPLSENGMNEKILIFTKNEKMYTFLSKGLIETDLRTVRKMIYSADGLILGKYGESHSSAYLFLHEIDSLEFIYMGAKVPFGEVAYDFYKEKGTPTETVGAQITIIR